MTSDIDTIATSSSRPLAAGARLIKNSTTEQRGWAFAALVTFLGVAFGGPALTRLMTPKTPAQKLTDEAAFRAEQLRRRAGKAGAKVRKRARRLGGGTIRR